MVIQIHEQRATPTPAETDSGFKSVAQASRIIREFRGLLPTAGHAARHILRCEHLRQLPGERFHPFRAEPEYTHQLWFWYRLHERSEQLILLFRGQFDLRFPEQDPDCAASYLTDRIAEELMTSMTNDFYLFRQQDSEIFWASLINSQVNLKGKSLIYL